MLSANNRIKETIASAPGTSTFSLPGTAASGGFRSWKDGITTRIGTGTRAVPYVACDNSSLFEIGVGYFDPSGNSGNGTITRAAALVSDGTSGRGSLVNFTAGNVDVFCDWSAVKLSYAGIDSYQISEQFSDLLVPSPFTLVTNGASGTSAGNANGGFYSNGLPWGMWFNTGSTTSGLAGIVAGGSNAAGNPNVTPGKGLMVCEVILRHFSSLSNGTDTFNTRFGFYTGFGSDPSNGVWFQAGGVVDAAGYTGHWALNSSAGGTKTGPIDSGVAASTTDFQRLRIELRHDGSRADFFIDGNNVGNLTTNMPTANIGPFCVDIAKTAGTTARTLEVDTVYFGYLPTAIRNG